MKEGTGFRDQAESFRSAGAEILGISFDSPEANKLFSRRWGLPFALLSDSDRKVAIAYGACRSAKAPAPKRITYLIDDQGKIARSWTNLKPQQHAAAVLEHLSQAGFRARLK